MSLVHYRRFVAVTAGLLALIVLTGAGVRLTEAGLGCTDWPNCKEGELLPDDEDLLGLIEYGNRMISGIVGLVTVAAAVLAHRVKPRRRDLIRWAWPLAFGSAAQMILGMAVVRLNLDPIAVAGHFILSMIMLGNAVVLWLKAGATESKPQPRFGGRLTNHGRLVVAAITVVGLIGTLVTGTGPNSGDSRAERLGFEFTTIARTHSVAAWIFLLTAVALAVRLVGHSGAETPDENEPWYADPIRAGRWLVYAALAQGAIGYWQYLTGVPPWLVELHILGSIVLWVLAVLTYFALFQWERADDSPPLSPVDEPDAAVVA